jgi:hypothetical protein
LVGTRIRSSRRAEARGAVPPLDLAAAAATGAEAGMAAPPPPPDTSR